MVAVLIGVATISPTREDSRMMPPSKIGMVVVMSTVNDMNKEQSNILEAITILILQQYMIINIILYYHLLPPKIILIH